MTFDATQIGPLGRTVELYEFSQAGTITRVTSAATEQTVGANTFEPLEGMSRTEPVQGNEVTSGDLAVDVPALFSIAQQFRTTIPSSLPSLTIFKKHLNDPDDALFTYWKGTVVACAFGDHTAVLQCRPITRVFDRPVPRAVYSGMCNHMLYDQGCKVTKADYQDSTLFLTTQDSAATTFTITGLRTAAQAIVDTLALTGLTAQEIDDFWMRGYIASLATPSEFRMIVETDIAGDPNAVRVNLPFRDLSVGGAIQLVAGCPHSLDFCDRKFNNTIEFGGYPYVPTDNPFEIELDANRIDNKQQRIFTFFGGGK